VCDKAKREKKGRKEERKIKTSSARKRNEEGTTKVEKGREREEEKGGRGGRGRGERQSEKDIRVHGKRKLVLFE